MVRPRWAGVVLVRQIPGGRRCQVGARRRSVRPAMRHLGAGNGAGKF